jgi:hypothetical protein
MVIDRDRRWCLRRSDTPSGQYPAEKTYYREAPLQGHVRFVRAGGADWAQGPQLGRDAARQTVVRVVDGRPKLLHPDHAGQGNEGDEQRILNEILAIVSVDESGK